MANGTRRSALKRSCARSSGECRNSYDVCAEIRGEDGHGDEFTEGRKYEEWAQYLYETGAAAAPETYGITMPSWEEMKEQGVFKQALPPVIGFEDFARIPRAIRLQLLRVRSRLFRVTADHCRIRGSSKMMRSSVLFQCSRQVFRAMAQ